MDITMYLLLIIEILPAHYGLDGTTTSDTDVTDEWKPPSCATTTCPEDTVCNDDLGFISCDCKEGMAGYYCDMPDPCVRNTTNCPDGMTCFADCPPNTLCEGSTGYARCKGCVKGWTGTDCLYDENECTQEDPKACVNAGVCVNTRGSYRCKCQPEWTGSDCSCKRGSECDPQSSVATTLVSSTLINSFIILVVSKVCLYERL